MLYQVLEILLRIIRTIVLNTISTVVLVSKDILLLFSLVFSNIGVNPPIAALLGLIILGAALFCAIKFSINSAKTIILGLILLLLVIFVLGMLIV
ncbi:MAG: hypothetical protein DRO96_02420 [Candidatus Aenigmatarchaeota archaeon]|nr:MAG: hypothetical protein DRO96_02420 [Candidatus Aenigmarchaeota archaeon]